MPEWKSLVHEHLARLRLSPERLVRLFANDHDLEFPHGMSYPDYLDYRQEQRVFSDLAACFIPARRATRVDPIVTLRSE